MFATKLFETGILQFGLFVDQGMQKPYRIRLEILPAYPLLLSEIALEAVACLSYPKIDRLVSQVDCIPFAAILSHQTKISLVYSRGRGESPVHDLVGAYDVGHPACLVVNSITTDSEALVEACKNVGLNIHAVLCIIGTGSQLLDMPVKRILSMKQIIEELLEQSLIPASQAWAVQRYIAAQNPQSI